MMRFMIPRIAHCSSGHAWVLGTTENCPHPTGGMINYPNYQWPIVASECIVGSDGGRLCSTAACQPSSVSACQPDEMRR